MTDLERAIAYIEDSRRSHLDAIEFAERLPKVARKWNPAFVRAWTALDGGIAFHRRCVKEYDHVLKVLRRHLP